VGIGQRGYPLWENNTPFGGGREKIVIFGERDT